MGSFRFRKSVRIAPGLRFNIGKKSIGISAGVPGARYSINSSGRRTRSIGIPGSGISYRAQSSASPGVANVAPKGSPGIAIASPTRLTASLVGWLTVLVFVLGIVSGAPQLAGTIASIGVVVYIVLRVAGGIFDPLVIWLLKRRSC
jgi:hypothetical protein